MNDNIFVDTSILLYSRDATEPEKQPIASAWLAELWDKRSGRLSVQVLNEYFVSVTQKLNPGLSAEEAWDDVEALAAWNPVQLDMTILNRTFAVMRRYSLSWWDSMIIASAEAAGCTRVLSEDLPHGAAYFGVIIENPFILLSKP